MLTDRLTDGLTVSFVHADVTSSDVMRTEARRHVESCRLTRCDRYVTLRACIKLQLQLYWLVYNVPWLAVKQETGGGRISYYLWFTREDRGCIRIAQIRVDS